ncbi:hypothetical protein ASPCAL07555 [Aspergillus calidoustus]|uniref:Uncharacterized protein n=1 Tax=Aspergillus calidoustus TaxID=454130 RepID=A0A0U5GUP2_ASPCI|nr:hypothetical protein ASPCAL07555 [Aspergillus calidoustus]
MSTTTTATGSAASASSTCHAKLYDIPTTDAACAMPNSNSTYLDLMTTCCGSAPVISYSNCDHYCLAQDQTGSEAGQAWCNTNANATATVTVATSVIAVSSATSTSTATTTEDLQADSTETNGAVAAVDLKSAGFMAFLALGGLAQLFI